MPTYLRRFYINKLKKVRKEEAKQIKNQNKSTPASPPQNIRHK